MCIRDSACFENEQNQKVLAPMAVNESGAFENCVFLRKNSSLTLVTRAMKMISAVDAHKEQQL